ncbi:uncharacterized protein J8A68_005636 [[Candida] subhashii]|uniref:Uncharacterized protein n=1 Tax=[Candida] subhashii TaxID=561895 RepID=A0A8J5QES0_9ASCO|nr:uncharacterized protein J8A68_005636 [[Candida] subhashii]KAG7660819.1 hypothetical protein J8A68_005636 [[Candida] subhashii]
MNKVSKRTNERDKKKEAVSTKKRSFDKVNQLPSQSKSVPTKPDQGKIAQLSLHNKRHIENEVHSKALGRTMSEFTSVSKPDFPKQQSGLEKQRETPQAKTRDEGISEKGEHDLGVFHAVPHLSARPDLVTTSPISQHKYPRINQSNQPSTTKDRGSMYDKTFGKNSTGLASYGINAGVLERSIYRSPNCTPESLIRKEKMNPKQTRSPRNDRRNRARKIKSNYQPRTISEPELNLLVEPNLILPLDKVYKVEPEFNFHVVQNTYVSPLELILSDTQNIDTYDPEVIVPVTQKSKISEPDVNISEYRHPKSPRINRTIKVKHSGNPQTKSIRYPYWPNNKWSQFTKIVKSRRITRQQAINCRLLARIMGCRSKKELARRYDFIVAFVVKGKKFRLRNYREVKYK